jgi:hypothetical protein
MNRRPTLRIGFAAERKINGAVERSASAGDKRGREPIGLAHALLA